MKRKLIISFIITSLLLVLLGAISITKMIQLSNLTQNLYEHPLSVTNSTKTIQANIISMHRYMKDVVLAKNKRERDKALSQVSKSEKIVYQEFKSVFNKYLGNKKDIQKSYEAFVKWKPIREEITQLSIAGRNIDAADITKTKGATHVKLLNEQVSKLIQYAQIKAAFFLDNSKIVKKEAILLTFSMLFIILLIISSILFLLLKKLSQSQEDMEKQNLMLLHQSRLAQMGEMISMIAHQWRQPLGSISATSIDLQMNLELETYDLQTKEGQDGLINHCTDSLKIIDSLIQNLTTTINDFRNFYKSKKELTSTLIRSPILKAFDIIRKSLEASNIEIIESYNTTKKVELYFNEFMQVVLNIFKNAQDNFNEKNIQNAKIIVTCTDTKNGIQVLITDNGGGISKDILPNIFDPYFSTKDKKNGTGLGLYMSKIIIDNNHNGKLRVESSDGYTHFKIQLNQKIKP